ncbi:asparagine synthase-related protein [Paenibacillus sp. YYML68]|uniref:asparagine synthase-related protein n=1 Tax=Paenibacillus sp. YYML68 TaxID=2909250 RepID=UPI002491AB42|nr:asparagine synthase-related protein [Paenibacillus sp. YYML68]
MGSRMLEQLRHYPFADVQGVVEAAVYLGCGLSRHTPESQHERLPRTCRNDRYVITADAIVDNREELLRAFDIALAEWPVVTDSELLLRAFERWGYDCPKHVLGDYAFAIWDKMKRELYVARDALGSRTLYYSVNSHSFAFCTLEKPLLGVLGDEPRLHEKWLADFLAIDGIQHEIDFEETVYEGIYQLPPASYGVWDGQSFRRQQHWDPLQSSKPIRYESDEAYVEAFNRIFAEAVACRLRSVQETGILLSGGMDSGSIACVAASQLEGTGRKLSAFCSVPVNGFKDGEDRRYIFNERAEVEAIVAAYPNIEVSYCSFEEKSALSDIETLVDVFEQPYKVYQNMTWYHSILDMASKRNCSIMLTGQVGNSTISYGDFRVHLLTLFRQGRYISCMQECIALSRLLKVPVRKVLKLAARVVTPYRLRRWRDRRRNPVFDRYRHVIVHPKLIERWDIGRRLDAIEANVLTGKFLDYEEDRVMRAGMMPLAHIGAVETKLSIANNITLRDPSRDRRVVEFCLNIPSEQFVSMGNERYLLRRAMKGILPEPIRANISTRGVQSADWKYRLELHQERLRQEMDEALANQDLAQYVDVDKMRGVRKQLEGTISELDEDVLRMSLITIIVHRFLRGFARNAEREV